GLRATRFRTGPERRHRCFRRSGRGHWRWPGHPRLARTRLGRSRDGIVRQPMWFTPTCALLTALSLCLMLRVPAQDRFLKATSATVALTRQAPSRDTTLTTAM